jgi:chorismate mutase
MVPEVSQHALDLGYDGLMVEVHPDPTIALSDAKQQLSPALATEMLSSLHRPKVESESNASELLAELRSQVDEVDEELLGILARRMKLIEALGTTKNVHGLALLQPNRWSEVVKSRTKAAVDQGLSEAYILKLLQVIHQESLAVQTEIRRKEASEKSIEPAENAEILN